MTPMTFQPRAKDEINIMFVTIPCVVWELREYFIIATVLISVNWYKRN